MVDIHSSNIFLTAPLKAARLVNWQFDETFKKNLVDISSAIGAGLSLHDTDMNIVWVNDIMTSWFGSSEKLIGKKCYEMYQKKDHICYHCPVQRVLQTNQGYCTRIQRGITKEGETRTYRLFAKPVRTEDGSILYVLELVQDITEERKKVDGLREKIKLMESELNSLEKISEDFAATFEIDRSIDTVLATTKSLLRADGCCVHLIDEKKGSFTLKSKERPSCALNRENMRYCNELSHHVVQTKKLETFEGSCSFMSVPISLGKNIVGVITVFNKRPYKFTNDEKCLLTTFANQSAILIGNEKLYRKLHLSYLNTIRALVSVIEAKDPHTKGHSEKVTTYALRIARALKLKKKQKRLISYCGRLHDIGKIAISDAILNKPGPLTNQEFVQVTKHPLKGADILRHLDFLKEGVLAIKHHHERYDGKGYPDGLKGEKIPIMARILTLADAYDAMTSDRAYRRGMTHELSVEEMKRCRGNHFDPDLVNTFLATFGS